jgi:hypothetical protein
MRLNSPMNNRAASIRELVWPDHLLQAFGGLITFGSNLG